MKKYIVLSSVVGEFLDMMYKFDPVKCKHHAFLYRDLPRHYTGIMFMDDNELSLWKPEFRNNIYLC